MTQHGLSHSEVAQLQKQYGPNILQEDRRPNPVLAFLSRFKNPLIIVLLIAATLSYAFGERMSFYLIVSIVLTSVVLDYVNTYRSEQAAEKLRDRVRVRVHVVRDGKQHSLPVSSLVPGDIVLLSAGSIVPADGIMQSSDSMFTNESALTGESFPQAKPPQAELYMGSGVVSGRGVMQVTHTGARTKFAHIARNLQSAHRQTEFEREIRDFSTLIVKITFFLVLFVAIVNMLFRHDILDSLLFSIALAVGLTPELLPLIITLNLTRGSLRMAKGGVIVKELSAIQNFGSMDVLCTDKTGTLTEDRIALVQYVDGSGQESATVLELGYLASAYSTTFDNPLDTAVKSFKRIDIGAWHKIDEIPFDFERKRSAVVAHHTQDQKRELIVKGAPEEVIKICTYEDQPGQAITPHARQRIMNTYEQLSRDGFRVLAVATRAIGREKRYSPGDEQDLCFRGFLAFLDPAKETVQETLAKMRDLGIDIKVITGDNAYVTEKIARDINLPIQRILTGAELARLDHRELAAAVEQTTVFARVDPEQKMLIIQALQDNGHVVGYMGDGINDAPSLRAADVGVSVNNAVDVAKAAADFILLHKELGELINGVADGRRTFANTMKYLRMELSSNFGNMFSMAGASLFLPFLPMLATQVLLNNLLYDTSQFAIPLDNVDDDEIKTPHTMSLKEIKRFMWVFGILSSVFDFITFGTLLFVFRADASLFQAGWFLESIVTQMLVVFIIRTKLIPFKQSRPAPILVLSSLGVAIIAVLIVLLPIRAIFQFGLPQPWQLGALGIITVTYLVSAELLKRWFYRRDLGPVRQ
jgi:P-type Mg2+ transporter